VLRCVNFNDLYAARDDGDVAQRLQQFAYPYANTAILSGTTGRALVAAWLGQGPLNWNFEFRRVGAKAEISPVANCNLRVDLVIEADV